MTQFQLPKLPWGEGDLAPFLSAETIEYHYKGHHQAYVKKTNELVEKMGLQDTTLEKLILNQEGTLYDNAAQAWNHTFYWYGLSPKKPLWMRNRLCIRPSKLNLIRWMV